MPEAMEFVPGVGTPNERRRHARQSIRTLIYAELDRDNGGIVLDASEGGMSVHAVLGLTEDVLPRMRVKLPETNEWLETRARVVWKQDSGKVAGLQFEELPDAERVRIREWLSREASESEYEAANDSAPAEQCPAEKSKPVNDHLRKDDGAFVGVEASMPAPGNIITSSSQFDKDDIVDESLSNSLARPAERAARARLAALAQTPASAETDTLAFDRSAIHPASARVATSAPALAQPNFLRAEPRSTTPIYFLLLVLAVLSATSGWAAGQGKLRPVVERFHKLLARNSAEGPVMNFRGEQPAPAVKEIEIIDANSQHRTISLLGAPGVPVPAIPQARTVMGATQTGATAGMNFQVWTLSPPKPSTAASNAGAAQKPAPPAVDDIKAGQDLAPVGPSGVVPAGPVALPAPKNMTGALKQGALIHRVEPGYPEIAMQQGVSGTVVLQAAVGVDGTVRDVQVISGPKLLIHAAVDAVRRWRYEPTLLDGKAIETHVEISLVFHLPNGTF
ncbi:MAG: TonB family protein [Candidatus Acidiferrales bacterium]